MNTQTAFGLATHNTTLTTSDGQTYSATLDSVTGEDGKVTYTATDSQDREWLLDTLDYKAGKTTWKLASNKRFRATGPYIGLVSRAKSKSAGPKAQKVVEPKPCLCGCGGMVKGAKSHFVPGHDARLYSLLRKIEKGEASESDIPAATKAAFTFAHCICCGAIIAPHESEMGPICRTGSCSCSKEGLDESGVPEDENSDDGADPDDEDGPSDEDLDDIEGEDA